MRTTLALLALLAATDAANSADAQERPAPILFAVGTSTYDTGLLDALIPPFEEKTRIRVKVIPVGSGQALALASRGEADLVLSHAPEAEEEFMAQGLGIARLRMMRNEFLIVGPPDDPARAGRSRTPAQAFAALAQIEALFVSRGDESGTHLLEKKLWVQAKAGPPAAGLYLETGQGQSATLRVASEKQGYALTDSATYYALRHTLQLGVVYAGDPALRNTYHLILTQPRNGPRVNLGGARNLALYLLSDETQERVREFGRGRFGQELFVPDADAPEWNRSARPARKNN